MNIKHIALAVVFASASFLASKAEAPAGYYSGCENKGGRNLLTALFQKVGPHTTVGYDDLYELYKTSDVRSNGTIWDMYSTKEWPVNSQRCGNYKNIGDCYNREHSFPKSWFSQAKPMYSDAFHLYPTDGKVNGQRSNYPYGECAGGTRLPDYNGVHALGRLGNSTFPGYTDKVFEPDDEYKGDFARSYFYMAAAYNDKIAGWSSPMLAKNAYPAFSDWAVNLLLKWHRQDPVSDKERKRNDAVYARQNNRNPFIDYPEMVEYIWGDRMSQTWTSSATTPPAINTPAPGTVLDMGRTARGVKLTNSITVRTTNTTAPVLLSFDGREFDVAPASLPASATNSPEGATAEISFEGSEVGHYSENMKVSCGSLSQTVLVKVEIVDGLPLLPAQNVTSESFDVCWTYVGDADASGCYILTVLDAGGESVSGFPTAVDARAGSYTVRDLDPESTYTFYLESQSLRTEIMTVTTAEAVPEVDFFFEGELFFQSAPGEPSPAAELWIETENVDADYTVSVEAPFQLSLNSIDWHSSLTLTPEDDRIYLRVFSEEEGEFESPLVARVGAHTIDNAMVRAIVAAHGADFLETFENCPEGMGSYTTHQYEGTAALWRLEDTGMWSSDKAHTGAYALRGGKSGAAEIELLEDRPSGIGSVRFWAHVWASDLAPEFDVLVSTDAGANWTKVGAVKLEGSEYKEYICGVNAPGNARIMLRQTAGRRFLLDDLSLSAHTSGLDSPEALHNRWDAFSPAPGEIEVRAAEPVKVSVFAVDGRVLATDCEVSPEQPLTLRALQGPEVYIVVCDNFTRRVLVR